MRRLEAILVSASVAGAAAAGCGHHGQDDAGSLDAGLADAAPIAPQALAAQRLAAARGLAAKDDVWRAVLGARATDAHAGLRQTGEAFTGPGFDDAAGGVPMAFGGRMSALGDGALEVRAGDARVALRVEGARSVRGARVDGEAVFADVHASTDLVVGSGPGRVEAFWLLRDPAAPTRFTLALELDGLTARLVDGALAFADAKGAVRVRLPRPTAVDANGVRRAATLALEGATLSITLDPRGLAFPILLDPALEQVTWTDLGPDVPTWPPPGTTNYARLTVPNGLQREGGSLRAGNGLVYLFGGTTVAGSFMGLTTPLATTLFQFDGAAWSATPGGGFADPLILANPTHGPLDRVSDFTSDPLRQKLVLFGGYTFGPAEPRLGVYEYDPLGSKAWAKVCADGGACYASVPTSDQGAPAPPSAAWAFNRTVLVHLTGTYEWDPTNAVLKKYAATPDLKRAGAGLAFDAARNRLVAYGDTTGLSDTWETDGTTWIKSPAVGPIGVKDPQLAYHAGRKRVVLWGSTFTSGGLWEWDGTAWSAVTLSGSGPSPRPNAAFTFDDKSGKLVLFGGGDLGNGDASRCFYDGYSTPFDNNDDFRTCARVDTWTSVLFGGACASSADCVAGTTCVDGVCCLTACNGSCQQCNAAGSVGKCTSVLGAEDLGTCSGTSACDATGVCRKDQGQACTLGTDCLSGNCADGFCCDNACAGACDACNQAGAIGTCTPLIKGSPGLGCGYYTCSGTSGACGTTCALDADCATNAFCSAAGACVGLQAKGAACARDRQCGSGVCVDGFCCDSACAGSCDVCAAALGATANGTCTPLPKTAAPAACGAARCSGTSGACAAGCALDADCSASGFCNGGVCAPLRQKGESCDRGSQCGAGLSCADGVCCNQACDGACQACAALNKQSGDKSGECGPAKEGTNPRAQCVKSAASSCGASGLCDAAGSCAVYAAGTACGPTGTTSCDGDSVKGQTCDGLGVCVLDAAGTPCTPGRCLAGACATSCATDADCATDGYCTAGTCKKKAAPGGKCGVDAQCGSGFCADGVCCNARCDRSCEACDQAGTEGTCTAVTGKPRVGHPACAAGDPTNPCSAAACDGVERATCAKKAGAEVACRAGSCDDGVESLPTTCDGSGACPAAQTRPCQPFACGAPSSASGGACNKSCAGDADCEAGFVCDVATGACTAGDQCVGSVVTHVDGTTSDCAPYVCESSGHCKTACAATTDCVSPKLCNEGACVDPADAPTSQQGGCAATPREVRTGSALWLIAALAGALRRRRRRENG